MEKLLETNISMFCAYLVDHLVLGLFPIEYVSVLLYRSIRLATENNIAQRKMDTASNGNEHYAINTLKPNKSNISTTSVLRGPMCRLGKSVLCGNTSLTVAK